MMLALFAGVSGLRNHQTDMDVIGNNIANVNTVGFKASRVTFQEAFVEQLQGATRPSGLLGGTDPLQIGTGMKIASIDQLMTQGSLETTGQPLDLAIQGDSFFALNSGPARVYTRAGNFQLDSQGHLVSPSSGYLLQGINADPFGNFGNGATIGDIVIPLGQRAPAQATSQMSLTGNLDAGAAVGTTHTMSISVYDSAGAPHQVDLTFTNTGPGAWSWTASSATATVTAGNGTVTFNANGSLASFTYPGGGASLNIAPTGGGAAFNVTIDAGTVNGINGLVGFANPSNAVINSQNGYAAGDLVNISVDTNGVVSGFFTNGVTRNLAQIAMATFNNPGGLTRSGNSFYQESPNSGTPVIGFAGATSSSTLAPGTLEASNVDLSTEFTNMIIAQRGFQANARVITTADEMLNELVNLRH
ncbi:MAG TPA: flagellar hook protein FlgE [Candidatus Sulfotelmatobacter sp.]|nr:flagellar hook protein FlgE [Candidatus Sulfotelmatobacter sp.]